MLGGFCSVGFAGSRSGAGAAAAFRLAQVAAVAAAQVSQVEPVVFTRAAFSGLLIRAQFAARAAAMVRALAAAPAPVLVCWPAVPASPAARPARSWVSCGSGTWSEAALAVGLGVSVVVFLPPGQSPPSWWGVWSLAVAGPFAGGWSLHPAAAPF